MKINISKFNISTYKLMVYAYLIIFCLAAAILAMVSLFLYKNFYLTITQSEELIILHKTVAPSDININKFNEVLSEIEQRKFIIPEAEEDNIEEFDYFE
jgi:hypothetical protein